MAYEGSQVDTNTTARTAKIMPNPCLMVTVSFKKMMAKLTLKIGYNADSGAMIETGPLETANRKHKAPTKPTNPANPAKAIPFGCVSSRKFIKPRTKSDSTMPPITSYTTALFGSMYLVVILGIKLHNPQQINVPTVGKIHSFIYTTPLINILGQAKIYREGLIARKWPGRSSPLWMTTFIARHISIVRKTERAPFQNSQFYRP